MKKQESWLSFSGLEEENEESFSWKTSHVKVSKVSCLCIYTDFIDKMPSFMLNNRDSWNAILCIDKGRCVGAETRRSLLRFIRVQTRMRTLIVLV